MSRPLIRPGPLTLEEYLGLEEASAVKHEYVAGEMYALAGVSPRHNLIALNIAAALRAAARGGPCRVYIADVKLRTPRDRIYYPDVMVVCVPGYEADTIQTAPCVVVEVTSRGTARIDRQEKLLAYQQIPELMAYLIVDQDRRRVERHWRGEDGVWRRTDCTEGAVPFPCTEIELTMDQIYEGVEYRS
ncbi:MAG: Uma2 family endonuclease [Gemmatimonadetes bacterium]|nr:Uma2 family endonuclease [Gemmatimonadota bacterium]